jgi:peptidoglycan/LPS O-acetylase OafA/YrhL
MTDNRIGRAATYVLPSGLLRYSEVGRGNLMTDVFPRSAEIGHKNNFDLIRLMAALQVAQTHVSGILSLPVKPHAFAFFLPQFPGVPIFFVVSGFLVTQSYRYGSGGVVSYFARRALRIYPALWVNITLIVLLLAVSGSLSTEIRGPRLGQWLLVTFLMGSEIAGNFFTGIITKAGGFYPHFPSGVTWTLVVEIGFYILLPIILIGRLNDRRYAWISLAAWTIISLLASHYYFYLKLTSPDATVTKVLSINTITYLWEFLIGATCSIYWDRLRVFFEGRFLHWLPVYLCAVVLIHIYFHVDDFNSYESAECMELVSLLMAGVVLSFAFTWPNAASILRGNDLSYGIYLYHMPIIITLSLFGFDGRIIDWFIVFGGSLTFAGLSWYLLERHALRFKTHIDRWLFVPSRAFSPSTGRSL